MVEFVTIGIHGWDAEAFFRSLQDAGVDTLCDIRRRRGVRGAEYAFANSQRLQKRLAELGIAYIHRLDLAPSNAARAAQHAVDDGEKIARRQRTALSPAFTDAYRLECLAGFDSRQFVASLDEAARVVALLCVEREPAACHRSLLADQLGHDLDTSVTHLLPPAPAQPEE